jgi:riboflavin-specific deaminase-like protein
MFIFSNLATSLDGKIAPADRSFLPLGSAEDWKEMLRLRSKCDAVLMGAPTLRVYRKPCFGPPSLKKQPWNILVSSQLDQLSPNWAFFKAPELHRLLFTGAKTPLDRIRRFERSCQVVVLKPITPKRPLAQQIIDYLNAETPIRRLLVEGGGEIIWEFSKIHQIAEYHITLTPQILGGKTAPTLVDGTGLKPKEILKLELKHCRKKGHELFLTYRNPLYRNC